MKKVITAGCLILALHQADPVHADDMFLPKLESAANQVIESWLANDQRGLSDAVTRLARYEYYHAAVVASECEGSYLCRIPPTALSQGENTLAAHVFLIRQEKEGVSLHPKSLFNLKHAKKTR